MIEEMVKGVITKTLASDFSHIQLPSIMRARITEAVPEGNWYKYSLRIIDKMGEIDERFPEIPGVMSKLYIETGKNVAIGLLYGELDPYIIGEVV